MLPLPTITTRDDRARPVDLWRPRANPDAEDAVPLELQQRIAAVTADRHKGILREPLTAAHVPFLLAILAMGSAPLLFAVFGIARTSYWTPVLFGMAIPALFYFRTRAIHRGMADTLRTTLLAEGHCASCGYSMRGLAPQADGCTPCPECGAAWRLDPGPRAPDREKPVDREKEDPTDIAQDRAARRQLSYALQSFGLRRRFAAVDATGRIVSLVSPDPFARRPAPWRQLDPARRHRIRRRFFRLGVGMRIAFVLLVLPGTIMMIWTWPRTGLPNPLADPLLFMGRVFGTFIWPIFILLFLFRPYVKRADVLVNLMLEERCCPSCAEPLADPPPDASIVVCRACGSSWDPRKAGTRARVH